MKQKLGKIYFWLRAINLKEAFKEITYIVIGISLAYTINNWNEGRKELANEYQMLLNIKNGLSQDLYDLENNDSSLPYLVEVVKKLAVDSESIANDSLELYYHWAIEGELFFVPNMGSYESLKTQGFQLIKSDTIKKEIATLYEYSYKWQLEKEVTARRKLGNLRIEFYTAPLLMDTDNMEEKIQYHKDLTSDPKFKSYLIETRNWNTYLMYDYKYLISRVTEVIELIDQRINELR